MDIEIEVPLDGVIKLKQEAYKDLIQRYLVENDQYNCTAVLDGVYPAMQAIEKKKSLLEVVRSISPSISGFQLNWTMNVLAEFSTKGSEIKQIWERYQKSVEPKKKSARKYKASELLDDE